MTEPAHLFPALGFFGSHPLTALTIPLDHSVRAVRLSVPGDFLNLKRLELLDAAGKPLDVMEAASLLEQSSAIKSELDAPSLLAGGGIHTMREENPWWRMEMCNPVTASALRIYNRGDVWGRRSLRIRVDVQDETQRWHTPYHGGTLPALLQTLDALLAQTAEDPAGEAARLEGNGLRRLNVALKRHLAASARLLPEQVRHALQLIDLYDGLDVTLEDLELLAHCIRVLFKKSERLPIGDFSGILNSERRLLHVENAVNAGKDKFVFTRHGITKAHLLIATNEYLDLARAVIADFRDMNRPIMIAYGTLLGAVRAEEFIAHDDDVDLLYLVDAQDGSTASVEVERIAADLRARGYVVRRNSPHYNMHVTKDGLSVDIFPCWVDRDRLFLHMERMSIRTIEVNTVLPLSSVRLYGHEFPAPANPEAFLSERYGDGWRTPDRFHEWPWPLNRAD